VRQALRDPAGATAIAEANLRVPGGGPPAGAPVDALPPTKARPMKVLGGHHVDHVFATWYRADRRTDLLLVVDVSGSMKQPVGGSPLINLVRQGCLSVSPLLPDDSRIGVWAFGSRLSGTRDYVERLPMRPLGQSHRRAYAAAINGLAPLETGTGLYDTILAAFTAATRAHRDGVPTQVLVFTDGINEFDAGSPSAQQFGARLEAAADPKRPVSLAVAAFGAEGPAKALEKLLEPVDGYVDVLEKPSDVPPVFVHVAAGGLHA
jgi:von Willebrand factor type A domain